MKNLESIVMAVIVLVAVLLFLRLPLYYLCNWLMPSIFNLRPISLIESFGLLVLSNILIKSSNLYKSKANV